MSSPCKKTTEVQVKFADGSEHTLPIHTITQLQLLQACDDVGIKDFREVTTATPNLQAFRFFVRIAAMALSFQGALEAWTVERIQGTFADMIEVMKVSTACINLSNFAEREKLGKAAQRQAMRPYS